MGISFHLMLAFKKNFQTLVKPLWQWHNANLSTQNLNAHIIVLPMCDSQFGSLFCYYCCFFFVITMCMTMHMIVVAPTILTMLAPYTFTSHSHNYNWFIILFFEIWAWDFINTSPFNKVVQWMIPFIHFA